MIELKRGLVFLSSLESLIDELCPSGVELVEIKKICKLQRGSTITKNSIVEGNFPVIAGGKKPAYYCNKFNREGNIITVSSSGANAGYVSYWTEHIFVSDAFSISGIENIVLTKYIYYYLKSIQNKIYLKKKGGGVPHVRISDVEYFKIPVPPIEVQNEIVRILDNFTELTEDLNLNLEKELEARKKQYEYYRDLLFTFGSEVERVELNKICKLERGSIITKNSIVEGKFPVVAGGKKPAYYCNKFNREGNIITVSSSGANAGYVSYWTEHIFVSDAFSISGIENIVLTKYIYYYLKSIQNKIYLKKKGGGVPHVKISDIKNLKIPLPPLHEQQRIVDILDRFDALCNDITKGLPAEIEARKKQYEYYRDSIFKKLLKQQ